MKPNAARGIRAIAAAALAGLALLASSNAHAEVAEASDGSFVLRAERMVGASPAQAWRQVHRVGRWWNPAHTYSGDAQRLSLDPRAGGCFCERWRDQSVEHGRVVMVLEHAGARTLRIQGALGPLQEMGVSGVLNLGVEPEGAGAKLTMSYRVAGDPALNLDDLAPLVDQVLVEQIDRLAASLD